MTWLNHWYQWWFAHYCIIVVSAPTFNSLFLNRLSQHPQLPSFITPCANTTAPRDTSRKGCASPWASRNAVRPSRRESWRNGCGLRMAYASHKPPSASPWNAVMSCWWWRWTPVSCPHNLHYVPVKLCSTRRWSLRSNAGSLSNRTRSTWMETCYVRRRHTSCKSFILMFQRWRSHKVGWRSSKIGTWSSHFAILGKAARWTWKQLARHYQTSAPLLMRTQRRTCSTWMKLGLCWRLQADNSLATHQLEGRKINKECITLIICVNLDNSKKIPLTIIDKHLNPCCFKGINRDTLGVRYNTNAKAWITQNVFRLWLLDFDRRMQGHQVLLLLDNCPGHIPLEKFAEMNVVLHNTRVFYLSPNMTLTVQPCNVGIIRTFKAYYKKRFNNLLLDGYENNIDNPKKISILDAFRLTVLAWVEDVSPTIIANCFRHCKIRTSDIIHTQQGEVGPPTALI